MSHSTIRKGIEELRTSEKLEPPERLRASGGGRKKVEETDLMFGRNNYPNAKGLMICADGGGSNGSRNKGWKFHYRNW